MTPDAIVRFSDLISAFLGLASAIVLGIPALKAVRAKRNFDGATDLHRNAEHPETKAALGSVRNNVGADQLGGSAEAYRYNLCGFSLLGASFLFLIVAAIARMCGG